MRERHRSKARLGWTQRVHNNTVTTFSFLKKTGNTDEREFTYRATQDRWDSGTMRWRIVSTLQAADEYEDISYADKKAELHPASCFDRLCVLSYGDGLQRHR